MRMDEGPFDDVHLPAVFPGISPADMRAVGKAARAVDTARAPVSPPRWQSAALRVVPAKPAPGVLRVVLLAEVFLNGDFGDDLELFLQVAWTDQGRQVVSAAVNVACWCPTDHASHDVDEFIMAIDATTSPGDAFSAGARHLISRLADPRDADHWRGRAGLPPRDIRWRSGNRRP